MDLLAAKIAALAVLLVVITFCTLIPLKVSGFFHRQGQRGLTVLSAMTCFGGGVFLGTYLLHMSPESREEMEHELLIEEDIDYALPELFQAAGFFLVLLTEQAVFWFSRRGETDQSLVQADLESGVVQNGNVIEQKQQQGNGEVNGHLAVIPVHYSEKGVQPHLSMQEIATPQEMKVSAQGHAAEHGSMAARSLILMVALSLDCIFEGMSTGLEDSVSGVWSMVIAILSHEFVIAFSLGLELVKYNSTKRVVIVGIAYGLTCPFGISIGIIISEVGGDSSGVDLLTAILLSMGAGVFLYVTFFQILQGEVTAHMKLYQIISILSGFAVMALLSLIPEDEGDDDEDEKIQFIATTVSHGINMVQASM